MSEKIYLAVTVGRQVQGEYVFVYVEKASKEKPVIESYLSNMKLNEATTIEGIKCVAERSIIEAELE